MARKLQHPCTQVPLRADLGELGECCHRPLEGAGLLEEDVGAIAVALAAVAGPNATLGEMLEERGDALVDLGVYSGEVHLPMCRG